MSKFLETLGTALSDWAEMKMAQQKRQQELEKERAALMGRVSEIDNLLGESHQVVFVGPKTLTPSEKKEYVKTTIATCGVEKFVKTMQEAGLTGWYRIQCGGASRVDWAFNLELNNYMTAAKAVRAKHPELGLHV